MAELSDYSIIVTAGPTREWFDPFRFISNPSSGKMGVALADCAALYSNQVTLLHGVIDSSLIKDKPYQTLHCETTADLLRSTIERTSSSTIIIMAAAPADYRPANYSSHKIKKNEGKLTITLERNPDILAEVAAIRENKHLTNLITVGFAAETENTEEYAQKKLEQKSLDFICLNDISKKGVGFGSDTNQITIFTKYGEIERLKMDTKDAIARNILEFVSRRL
ncbi:MAG: phosphopantothenoylcysteine decarboxylase [Spirochaetes bacterium]|jgi:phosphopantothenoylcysteine synthetase/decarboxylase|nr:phosphopantothenoylcysteine decarboxylase [Spirochaetota bacterium]